MKITVFSAHSSGWRRLCKALADLGHRVVFFQHGCHADAADWCDLPGGLVVLYDAWDTVTDRVARELHDSDAAIVTSSSRDALHARDAIAQASSPIAVFYDLAAPMTLDHTHYGEAVPYIDAAGLAGYDLVLSCAGGAALEEFRTHFGAQRVRALYGHVDPELYQPVDCEQRCIADLSWLGSLADDRQPQVQELLVEPARRAAKYIFLIAGTQSRHDSVRGRNLLFVPHVRTERRAAFFSSSRLTLNLTREPAARMGWCPSRRLFQAAACGAAIVSDEWSGLGDFYEPGEEILLARNAADVLDALSLDDATLRRVGRAARERTLAQHTSTHRARLLLRFIEEAAALDGGSDHAGDSSRRRPRHSPANAHVFQRAAVDR